MLRNAVVGLQSFCFKDRACLRETVYTRALSARACSAASLRLVFKGTKGALFRGM